MQDFTTETVNDLKILAKKHNFLVFEGRKPADPGNPVQEHHRDEGLTLSDFAPVVNVNILDQEDFVEALPKFEALPKSEVCRKSKLCRELRSRTFHIPVNKQLFSSSKRCQRNQKRNQKAVPELNLCGHI